MTIMTTTHLRFEGCEIGGNILSSISNHNSNLGHIELINCEFKYPEDDDEPYLTEIELLNTRIIDNFAYCKMEIYQMKREDWFIIHMIKIILSLSRLSLQSKNLKRGISVQALPRDHL